LYRKSAGFISSRLASGFFWLASFEKNTGYFQNAEAFESSFSTLLDQHRSIG
jgi:hypothetical protein